MPQAVADLYPEKQGAPENQFGVSSIYSMDNGIGFTISGNYSSSTHSGRWLTLKLPPTKILNFGMFHSLKQWRAKLDMTTSASVPGAETTATKR